MVYSDSNYRVAIWILLEVLCFLTVLLFILQPETIGALFNLKDLWLDGNQLAEIPQVKVDSTNTELKMPLKENLLIHT